MHQMHKYAQHERYAKLNWEPVQTPKRRSDVLSNSGTSDESVGCTSETRWSGSIDN